MFFFAGDGAPKWAGWQVKSQHPKSLNPRSDRSCHIRGCWFRVQSCGDSLKSKVKGMSWHVINWYSRRKLQEAFTKETASTLPVYRVTHSTRSSESAGEPQWLLEKGCCCLQMEISNFVFGLAVRHWYSKTPKWIWCINLEVCDSWSPKSTKHSQIWTKDVTH